MCVCLERLVGLNLITVGCDVPRCVIKKCQTISTGRFNKLSPSASFTILFVCNMQQAALKNAHAQRGEIHPSQARRNQRITFAAGEGM